MRLFLASLLFTTTAHASFSRYGTYLPTTTVTDTAALDRDQYVLNEQLSSRKFDNAMHVYKQGGYSGSFAKLSLQNLGQPSMSFAAGTRVYGKSESGNEVVGYIKDAISWPENSDAQEIHVYYEVGKNQDDYLNCQVGGLWHFSAANRVGCFHETGTVNFVQPGYNKAQGVEFEYSYNTRSQNDNAVTLQKLSTDADNSNKGPDGKYYPEYRMFLDYYGSPDYGDKFIMAAHDKKHTNFKTGRGDHDFRSFSDRLGQAEAIKKGSAYLNVFMEVVRHLNDAIAFCKANVEGAEVAIDKAAVLYTGSLVATTVDKEGILLYALAEIRSHQFKTAGHVGDKDSGDAYVNIEIMKLFKEIQNLVAADDAAACDLADTAKHTVIKLMKVPLIQGLLRYAYKREFEIPEKIEEEERAEAEAATFGAAILPFVHNCKSANAKVIHQQIKIGAKTDFAKVKHALEHTYECMGVTCELVGGIWNKELGEYKSPMCGQADLESSSLVGGIFMFFAVTAGLSLAAVLFLKYRHRFSLLRRRHAKREFVSSGNIAAVTEIA